MATELEFYQKNFGTEQVHISQINKGDTVVHNGEVKTVSGNNIHQHLFNGKSIFGDSYHLGNKKVTRVKI